MKKIIIAIVVILAAVGVYFVMKKPAEEVVTREPVNTATSTNTQINKEEESIGKSVEGADIMAYHYGTGSDEILFIGGIHGGYEANTSLVAYEAADYLKANLNIIPANVKVTVIPVLNPDGLKKVVNSTGRFLAKDIPSLTATVPGRFNAREVDLNRNFDCDWQADATWQNKKVSGGSSAFSEPESQAIKNYVEKNKPKAVVTFYSAAGGVYASSCHNGVSTETNAITKVYADASHYPAHQEFNFYEITGDMVNWLAKNNIPAISVLLTNHTDTEWTKNQAGIDALLKHYSK